MNQEILYLADNSVDAVTDSEIRTLLTTCFTKPEDAVFKYRRYFREPYPHRWVIRDSDGQITAHIGVHEKQVLVSGKFLPIGGIAEVCVHPEHRRQGFVRLMLEEIHQWLTEKEFVYSVLFGDSQIYSSSGYRLVINVFMGSDRLGWEQASVMIRELGKTPWPEDRVFLNGPSF